MLQSLRAAVVIESKSSRKRRWISSISRTTHPASILSPPSRLESRSGSFQQHSDRHCKIFAQRDRTFGFERNKLHLFSTSSNNGENKDETEADNKHDIPTEHQPTIQEQIKSLPNIITISRLASTPLLCYWVINDEPYLAIAGCFLAGVSDVLDGYIAKNHDQKTVLGTYLDPFADKFFINSLSISLWYIGILPTPLVALWASKDFLLLGGMGWYLYQEQKTINFFSNSIHTKPLTVTPSTLGKANTGLQFLTLAVGIATPVVSPEILQPFVLESLCWATGASAIITTLSYAGKGRGFTYNSKSGPITNKKDIEDTTKHT